MLSEDNFNKLIQESFNISSEWGYYKEEFQFKTYSQVEHKDLIQLIDDFFIKIIKDRDIKNIDRYLTMTDCNGMSVLIHRYLKSLKIPSLIVIGDIYFDGNPEYKTSYSYLQNEHLGFRSEEINYHVWVVSESGMIIDATQRLKEELREEFLHKKILGKVGYRDFWDINNGIAYIPFLIGEDFLNKTNPCPYF